MVAYTTTYNLKKPTVADDEDVWGGYLNDSMDIIDDVLDGTVPVTGIDINSGTLDNVVIGGATANTGTFTVLSATTSLGVTGNITVSGTVDGRDVAADGTKLDGIESGATADQTKADIDALGIAASTAATLATARNIALSGDVSGNVNFDGSGNVTITTTVADDSHNHVISNVDGLQTALDGKLSTTGTAANSQLLDSLDSSQFLRSDAADSTASTISFTGDIEVGDQIFHHGDTDTYMQFHAANQWRVVTGGTEMLEVNDSYILASANLDINADINGVNNIFLAGTLYHEGDTDTYLTFGTDTITLATGGSSEITVNTTGVRLGDTGNGYFQPVTGTYGSIQIDGGAHGGYEGYSIGGRVVWMHDNGNYSGFYNEVHNQWQVLSYNNAWTALYYAGGSKLQTTSTGVNIEGDLNAVDNIYLANSLIHEGDTDTKLEFGTNYINLITGNSTSATLNSSGIFVNDGSVAEDYDALSGTTPTCNVDNGGMFSLTMTGNTTFTFSGASSGYVQGFILQLVGNGSTVTWPTSVDWAGGTAPDAPASGETDIYVFITRDGGTTWYGVQSIDAAA